MELPQLEVYTKMMLSPIVAAALLLYLILMILEVNEPESRTAVEPTLPFGIVHKYPVGAADTDEALVAGNAGAVYL